MNPVTLARSEGHSTQACRKDQTVVRPDLAVICGAAPVGHLTPTNMRKLKRVAAALGGSAHFNGFPPAKAVHVNQE